MYGSHYMQLKQLAEVAMELGLDTDPYFYNSLLRLSIRWNQRLYEQLVKFCLKYSKKPLIDNPFSFPIKEEDLKAVDGKYKIGTITGTDIEYGIHPEQIQMHGVITGGSGYGKSSLVKVLLEQIIGGKNE